MYDPISVSTALVSAGGDLLIELTDGTIINAGRVRGNPGPKGDTGDQGIRGAHGKDGIDGTNGAKWHTGVGAPDLDLGVNGDLYMDVAASVLPIYQKVNGSWMFLANLKVAPAGGGGGGSAAPGGDGRPPIIYPPTNPGQQPGTYPGGGALEDGDLWWDPDSGYLYIYLNGEWHPIGERPPVAVQPTPPDYNASGDIDNQYPIVEGDLWFDSDQGALYVAVTNVDGDLVWVITTPADRTILEDEIPTTRYVFPAAADKQIEVNDTTGISYIYNASKNQWIDLPKSPGWQYFQDDAPEDNDENNLRPGDLWINSTDNLIYVWTGDNWAEVSTCSGGGGGTGDVTKEYVDAQDQKILDALAPTIDTGAWEYRDADPMDSGVFQTLLTDPTLPSLEFATDFESTKWLKIRETDLDGEYHYFLNYISRGNAVQLFDDEGNPLALYFIRAEAQQSTDRYYLAVDNINVTGSFPASGDKINFKFYTSLPGTSGEYVSKRGDTVSGPLILADPVDSTPYTFIGQTGINVFELKNNLIQGDAYGELQLTKTQTRLRRIDSNGTSVVSEIYHGSARAYILHNEKECYMQGVGVSIRSTAVNDIDKNYISVKDGNQLIKQLSWDANKVIIHSEACAGEDAASAFMATEDNHIATKKYADNLLDFSQYEELS